MKHIETLDAFIAEMETEILRLARLPEESRYEEQPYGTRGATEHVKTHSTHRAKRRRIQQCRANIQRAMELRLMDAPQGVSKEIRTMRESLEQCPVRLEALDNV